MTRHRSSAAKTLGILGALMSLRYPTEKSVRQTWRHPNRSITALTVFLALSKEILRNAVKLSVPHPSRSLKQRCRVTPVKILVDASDGADLFVVGNRGHRNAPGSVSGQILAYAHCPTVIVRA